MVAVVQLVEHQVVILGVAGSSPVSHPKIPRDLHKQVTGYIALIAGYVKEYVKDSRNRVKGQKCVWLGVSLGLDLAFWTPIEWA